MEDVEKMHGVAKSQSGHTLKLQPSELLHVQVKVQPPQVTTYSFGLVKRHFWPTKRQKTTPALTDVEPAVKVSSLGL
jgi:hypothetical protein